MIKTQKEAQYGSCLSIVGVNIDNWNYKDGSKFIPIVFFAAISYLKLREWKSPNRKNQNFDEQDGSDGPKEPEETKTPKRSKRLMRLLRSVEFMQSSNLYTPTGNLDKSTWCELDAEVEVEEQIRIDDKRTQKVIQKLNDHERECMVVYKRLAMNIKAHS